MLCDTSGLDFCIDSQCRELNLGKQRLIDFLNRKFNFLYPVGGKNRGRHAWHYVMVDGDKKEKFLEKCKTGKADIADYGEILCSGWGKDPPLSCNYKLHDYTTRFTADLHIIRERNNAWHYVLVHENKKSIFEKQFKSVETIEDYATVLYSGWGQDSPDSIVNTILSVYLSDRTFGLCNKDSNLLHDFARSGRMDEMRQIIDKGFDIHGTDANGWSPVHHAAYSGKAEVLKFLTSKGVSINLRDKICGRKPIHVAAREGHENVIKFFLQNGAGLDDADKYGWLPIHYAAWKGNLEAIKLVHDNAVIDAKDNYGKKPIHVAAENGHMHVVDFFLRNGINIEVTDFQGQTPLYYAAMTGHLATTDFLIGKEANIHVENINGVRPLHTAAFRGHTHIVERFLSEGLSVDEPNRENETPLHFSVIKNHLELANFLIEKGADVNAENLNGKTPFDYAMKKGKCLNLLKRAHIKSCSSLHFAAMKGNLGKVKFFVSQDANVNIVDRRNYTPLHYAAEYGNLDVLNFLLEKEADVLTRSNPDTVLHLAVRSNDDDVIRLILNAIRGTQQNVKPHINAQDAEGNTPLTWAIRKENINAVQVLLEHGADIHLKNNDGLSVLHQAAKMGHFRIVQLLVDRGADIHDTDSDSCQPIHYAAMCDSLVVMQFFMNKGVSVNCISNFGAPLHCAAYAGKLRAVEFLIGNTASINTLNIAGMKPIHCATMCTTDGSDSAGVIEELLNNGASVNDTDTAGKTPLHYSVERKNLEMIKFLMNRKANVCTKDGCGKTPLDWAKEKNYFTVVELLGSFTINSS